PDVTAPLTRKLLFLHPASAWASFAAYFVVFAASIALLNERDNRYDRAGRAAAEVGFALNTVALLTGTLWGLQEWSDEGQAPLATIYSEPKVLVVLVLWLTFAAYLLLRRLVDGPERRARMAAAFGVLGFLAVPASFVTSRLLQTSLHPDIAGPGANPDAAVGREVGLILAWSLVAFILLFLALFLERLRLLAAEERLEELEELREA
ncbi:MAG TPA: cytochrome c biogenesis protein CcsA, partial [Candidatus Thermoplasmatota archaeon]|nr:cytochrome c biogenesis protein CcsA [Candidatus Thermoplasmatota archaeon]